MRFKFDWFMGGMLAAVGLAWIFPGPGSAGGWMHAELLNNVGVALVFFLNGVTLSFADLKAGTQRWPVHLVVQLSVFAIFPLVGLGLLALAGSWLPAGLGEGFFYLCVLPSTVSSSVALTTAARGNVPAAVFNAALSSLLGVVLTPVWVSWRLHAGGTDVHLGGVVVDLVLWLMLPLALGQISRVVLAGWAKRHRRLLYYVDRIVILLIIYTSFCDSVKAGIWHGSGMAKLAVALVGCLLLFTLLMVIVRELGQAFRFPVADRITAMFCGSKKSIAQGVPMGRLIFGASPQLSVVLLPLMIYHPLQLLICSVLAERWARRTGD